MTLNIIFITQLASILGFVVVLFTLYKTLVSAKDATIETLKQQINLNDQKIRELENQEPDILIAVLKRRATALEEELQRHEIKTNISDEENEIELQKVESIDKKLKENEFIIKESLKITKRTRVASAKLRQYLLNLYNGSCQVCGQHNPSIMEISHIKSFSEGGEPSIENMLLMCPNDHRLFDRGSFSINDNLQLVGRSGSLHVNTNHKISKEFLAWHRDNIFKNNI